MGIHPTFKNMEDFWSLLGQIIYTGGYVTKFSQHLKTIVRNSVKNIDDEVVQITILGIKSKEIHIQYPGSLK